MAKNEKKTQTIVHMTQHRKLKNKQKLYQKLGVISCAQEGKADPAPHVAPAVLLM